MVLLSFEDEDNKVWSMHVKISRLHGKLKYVTSKLIEEMECRKKCMKG